MKLKIVLCCIICFSLLHAENHKTQYQEYVTTEMKHIPGWCSEKKAEAMMQLIFETHPSVCVELGVFAGASLFPTAMALKYLDNGIVYAIDAWNTEEAIRYYLMDSPHREWWKQQDMKLYYNFTKKTINQYQLSNYCVILKNTFAKALDNIDFIDILHIDASHTNEGDLIDVLPYCSKIREGGYIWFDGWATSPTLYEHLKTQFQIKRVINGGQCILMQKI